MPTPNRSKPDIEAVYFQYADLLYRVALAQLGHDADAQDAVQDVLIRYITKAPAFFSRDHEKAWLLRSTVNRCHDIARRNNRQTFLPLDDALQIAAEDQGGLADLLETLSRLPEKYKDTVVLHCLEGFSLQETAKILGISLSAAKMRLSRAREILKNEREEEDDVL